jgi:alpha,alpha-trehalase
MRRYLSFLIFTIWSAVAFAQRSPDQLFAQKSPDQIYGALFENVQLREIFPDQKTFVDCVPIRRPSAIMADYGRLSNEPTFNLKVFVARNFIVPPNPDDITTHIKRLWRVLSREPSHPVEGSSLLALPHPYIVPGGRFDEIYYWDSYFTMLGLRESDEIKMIENMVENFASLIDRYGFIPNGNRTYYLSRSQPPFFSLMVELLAEEKGNEIYENYLGALQKEYNYWLDQTGPTEHCVKMPNGTVLARYYDQLDTPRPESYRQDVETSKASREEPKVIFRNLRSAAESGWDFSSRWFADGENIATIETTNVVPVDLNCLLYHLECVLARSFRLRGDSSRDDLTHAKEFEAKAQRRKEAINEYCWSSDAGWYVDCDLNGKPRKEMTLAGVTPLFFGIAPDDKVGAIVQVLKEKFVKPGGVVTTLRETKQQWDAPNGWAPLQWLTVKGLQNYGQDELAKDIAERWIRLNVKVYRETGKLMEKYNVEDLTKPAGGGEYPGQDGFGWTNGVLLKLISLYGVPSET